MKKDRSIIDFLKDLEKTIDKEEYKIVDYWDGDLCAIGIENPINPGTMIYISTFDMPYKHFYVNIETPICNLNSNENDITNFTSKEFLDVEFNKLIDIICKHLTISKE